jgi:predicted transcriptional regulator of viral defense system
MGLSAKRKSYLSHASALWVHGIGGSPRELFVNHEQGEKPANDGSLTQEAIHRAFRNQPRHSKLIYRMNGNTITIVNGKHTGRLGVEQAVSPNGDLVDVTSLERTLIDVAVRPNYGGGVIQVLKAFTSAQGRVSVRKMAHLLKTLDYTYPYHQAIGFYLMRSGYPSRDQRLFSAMGINLDFYLSHGLVNPVRDPEWRIFYPRELD